VTNRWVINASPLILLDKAGQLGWIHLLGEVVIPKSVVAEICEGPEDDPARQWVESTGCELSQPDAPISNELMAWDLGAGETAVIAWAVHHPGMEAVLDDGAARACAGVSCIPFRGTLSLVAVAKRRGFLPPVRPVFDRLQMAGLFVTPALIEQVAKAAGE
jgi:predicted nucleic acid-binding protein